MGLGPSQLWGWGWGWFSRDRLGRFYRNTSPLTSWGQCPCRCEVPFPLLSLQAQSTWVCATYRARGLEDLHTLQEAQGHRCVYNIPSTKGHHIPPVLSQHPLDPSTEWELEMGAQGPPCVC